MIQRVMAGKRRLNVDVQAVLNRLLTDVLPQGMRAQCRLHRAVFGLKVARHQSLFHFLSSHSRHCAQRQPNQFIRRGILVLHMRQGIARLDGGVPQRSQRLDGFGEIIRRRA